MELKTAIRQHLHLQALAGLNAEVRQQLLTQSDLPLTGHPAEGNRTFNVRRFPLLAQQHFEEAALQEFAQSVQNQGEPQKGGGEPEGRMNSTFYPGVPWG